MHDDVDAEAAAFLVGCGLAETEAHRWLHKSRNDVGAAALDFGRDLGAHYEAAHDASVR